MPLISITPCQLYFLRHDAAAFLRGRFRHGATMMIFFFAAAFFSIFAASPPLVSCMPAAATPRTPLIISRLADCLKIQRPYAAAFRAIADAIISPLITPLFFDADAGLP